MSTNNDNALVFAGANDDAARDLDLGPEALMMAEGGGASVVGEPDPADRDDDGIDDAAATPATIEDVFSTVGIELSSFLSPRDLFPLTLSNKRLARNVRDNLFYILLRQQEGESSSDDGDENDLSGASASTVVIISKEHSFASKDELAESLLNKIEVANLRYEPLFDPTPDTLEETLLQAREDILHDDSRWRDCAWHGTFKNDPAEIWKPLRKPFDVSCRFEATLHTGRGGHCFIDWMLREVGQRDPTAASRVTKDWARFIIAQKGVVGREWQWKCDGEECVGFMIYSPAGDRQLEIKLIRKEIAAGSEDATSPPPFSSLLSASGFSETSSPRSSHPAFSVFPFY